MMNPSAHTAVASPSLRWNPTIVAVLIALGGLTAWAFWPTFTSLIHLWNTDDGYSHGYLVPAFSAYLLWSRREMLPKTWSPRPILGLTIIALAWALRIVAGLRFNVWPEAVAMIPFLLGIVVAFGGWPLLRYSWPAIAFLIFMIRLPYRFEVALGAPLQELATTVSTFILQCLGQPALAEGKTIHLRDMKLEVVQACSGLKMLFTFVAFSTAVCLLVKKPISDRLVILFSAVPIAIFVNVIRITSTGLAYQWWSGNVVHQWSHDLAGWLMMPLALALLGVELWILKHLITETPGRAMVERRVRI